MDRIADLFNGTLSQIRFDPLDWIDSGECETVEEAEAKARVARDLELKAAKAAGWMVRGFRLTGQLRKYRGFGDPCGRVRTVYYISKDIRKIEEQDTMAKTRQDDSVKGWPFPSAGERRQKAIDEHAASVIHSRNAGNSDTNPPSEDEIMSDTKTPTKQEVDAAKAQAKIAEKAAKLEAAAKAKAEKEAAKKAKAEAAEAEKAAKAKAREEAKANRQPPTSMSQALGDRTKSGLYVKGVNGQLRTNDEVALALEVVPVKQTVEAVLKILGLPENPYTHLNYGQQSMNLRNRLRGQVRKTPDLMAKVKEIAATYKAAPAPTQEQTA